MLLAVLLALHVVGVVLWIGGVGMATLVVLPAARAARPLGDGVRLFKTVEHRFAPLARWMVALVGVTGVLMLWLLDLWAGFRSAQFWWLHAMALVWLFFATMLFVVEPLAVSPQPVPADEHVAERRLRRLHRVHIVLLILSLVTVAGAVAGARGVSPFG